MANKIEVLALFLGTQMKYKDSHGSSYRPSHNDFFKTLKDLHRQQFTSNSMQLIYNGCGETHGLLGTAFAFGLLAQVDDLIDHLIVITKNHPERSISLRAAGFSRGAIACYVLANKLANHQILSKKVKLNIVAIDPVPGNSRLGTMFSLWFCRLALSCQVLQLNPLCVDKLTVLVHSTKENAFFSRLIPNNIQSSKTIVLPQTHNELFSDPERIHALNALGLNVNLNHLSRLFNIDVKNHQQELEVCDQLIRLCAEAIDGETSPRTQDGEEEGQNFNEGSTSRIQENAREILKHFPQVSFHEDATPQQLACMFVSIQKYYAYRREWVDKMKTGDVSATLTADQLKRFELLCYMKLAINKAFYHQDSAPTHHFHHYNVASQLSQLKTLPDNPRNFLLNPINKRCCELVSSYSQTFFNNSGTTQVKETADVTLLSQFQDFLIDHPWLELIFISGFLLGSCLSIVLFLFSLGGVFNHLPMLGSLGASGFLWSLVFGFGIAAVVVSVKMIGRRLVQKYCYDFQPNSDPDARAAFVSSADLEVCTLPSPTNGSAGSTSKPDLNHANLR